MYKESGYYPEGAEFDPNAPWNEVSLPQQKFNVYVSQSLSKDSFILSNDYNLDEDNMPDTSFTCWVEEYKKSDHYTPLQLIGLFSRFLKKKLETAETKNKKHFYEHLIEECNGWVEDETIIEEAL